MCNSFFESRFHAYIGISWYFFALMIVSIGLGGWALDSVNEAAVAASSPPGPGLQYNCGNINRFLKLIGACSVLEGIISGVLAFAFITLMRGYLWALFAIGVLLVYGLLIFLKAVTVIVGVVWIWGDAQEFCSTAAAPLYVHADLFLKAVIGVLTVQLLFGTSFLMGCGLHHAIDEALHHIRGSWRTKHHQYQPVATFGA
eukprot:TRINITY_DN88203_c0_g1_i1.p1 TRINITY_DN88203_c0_g1~~TRINITY_DN88203_c0_g1_i1.p1  ORF type:complete len:208 (-),score=59.20 TRINITY_DN88203_c0_g1_i1:54-653(-)